MTAENECRNTLKQRIVVVSKVVRDACVSSLWCIQGTRILGARGLATQSAQVSLPVSFAATRARTRVATYSAVADLPQMQCKDFGIQHL